MAFDFPASPAEGQVFTPPSGPTYVFNTPVWKAVGQGQIAIISDTPPSNPANGALWYESDSGVLFIWYNDGNSSQWVQVGGVMQPPPVEASGVFKISGGEALADFTQLDIALPTGYFAWELYFKGLAVAATATPALRFSWDGGTSFPASATEYRHIPNNAVNGVVATATSDQASISIGASYGVSAVKRGHHRIWMPVVASGERATIQYSADHVDSTAQHSWRSGTNFSLLQLGPPNVVRLLVSASTMLAGFKWQLNGIK